VLAVVLLVVAVVITVAVTRIVVRPLKRASKQILAAAKLDVAGDTRSVAGLHVRELDDMSEGTVRQTYLRGHAPAIDGADAAAVGGCCGPGPHWQP